MSQHITGRRVESLANHIAVEIDRKHAALNAAVSQRTDPMTLCRLIGEIWSLTDEFACAVYVEQRLDEWRDAERPPPARRP